MGHAQSEEGREQEEEEELVAQVGIVSVVSLCRTFLLQQLLEVVVVGGGMLEVAGIIEGCSLPLSLSLSISTNCCILNPICSAIRPMLLFCDAIARSKRDIS